MGTRGGGVTFILRNWEVFKEEVVLEDWRVLGTQVGMGDQAGGQGPEGRHQEGTLSGGLWKRVLRGVNG